MIEGMSCRLLRRTVISLGVAAAVGSLAAIGVDPRGGARGDVRLKDQRPSGPLYAGRRLSEWTSLLREGNEFQRLCAARSLGDMGADARQAVPDLIESLSEADSFIRSAAAYSLGQIGPDAAGYPRDGKGVQEEPWLRQGHHRPGDRADRACGQGRDPCPGKSPRRSRDFEPDRSGSGPLARRPCRKGGGRTIRRGAGSGTSPTHSPCSPWERSALRPRPACLH